MYKLTYKTSIACAHNLQDSESLTTKKCLGLHGHNYGIEIKIETEMLINGMVMDFGKIKEIIDKYDHQYLNEFDGLENPTTENLTKKIYEDISLEIKKIGFQDFNIEIIISESDKGSISYKE